MKVQPLFQLRMLWGGKLRISLKELFHILGDLL